MSAKPKISGFTIVRNAQILGYPFLESVRSVAPFCSEFIINCGDSTDNTRQLCLKLQEEFPHIRIIDSVWTASQQSGGFQLRHQTDTAAAECKGDWCFYIQSDEVFHEADWPELEAQVARAEQDEAIDGLVFNYVHFYGSYDYTIRGRNWYRREIRLFKNGRKIQSFRDAQGFRKNGARLKGRSTNSRIFHYGYVRSSDSLRTKSTEMTRWWGETPPAEDRAYELINHVGLRRFTQSHPAVMSARIAAHPGDFDPKHCRRKWDRNEIKNALTLAWESIFRFRLGEFRNYDLA